MPRLINIEVIIAQDTVGEGTVASPVTARTNLYSKDGDLVLSWYDKTKEGKCETEIYLDAEMLLEQIKRNEYSI